MYIHQVGFVTLPTTIDFISFNFNYKLYKNSAHFFLILKIGLELRHHVR